MNVVLSIDVVYGEMRFKNITWYLYIILLLKLYYFIIAYTLLLTLYSLMKKLMCYTKFKTNSGIYLLSVQSAI